MPTSEASYWRAVQACFWYSVCSSLLLIFNKISMEYIPVPSLVSVVQLISCSGFIFLLGCVYHDMVDKLEWSKIRPYSWYVAAFSASIYTNMRALESSNVETIIVFRCCLPIVISVCDYLFLGRDLPNLRSLAALIAVIVGAVGYVMSDAAFRLDGVHAYLWVTVYFFLLCFCMTYGKKITDSVPMKTMWGPTLYSNLLGIPPTLLMGFMADEYKGIAHIQWTQKSVAFLGVACALGVGIGYTSWSARRYVSATTYTLVGVVNKLATVAVNVVIWDQHASSVGLLWLVVCIAAGAMYQQAPMREIPKPTTPTLLVPTISIDLVEKGKEESG